MLSDPSRKREPVFPARRLRVAERDITADIRGHDAFGLTHVASLKNLQPAFAEVIGNCQVG
jgi:hypothetical protein